MTDEFHAETYDDDEFDKDDINSDIGGSQHIALEIKQKKAQSQNQPNQARYQVQRELMDSISNSFDVIHQSLIEYSKKDKEQYRINVLKRLQIEKKVIAQLEMIGILTEPSWTELARYKETLSYRFGARKFPSDEEMAGKKWSKAYNKTPETAPETTQESTNTPESTETEKTKEEIRKEVDDLRRATRDNIMRQYNLPNVRGVKNFMDNNYVDENGETYVFKPLSHNQYYNIVNISDLEHMFQICYDEHLYAIMLALWCHLVCSRQFVHLLLQSNKIVDYMFNPNIYTHETIKNGKIKVAIQNPFLDAQNKEIIYHCMFYGIYILTREEFYVGVRGNDKFRYVLNLDVISKIPPYEGNLENNPFIPVTLSNNYLFGLNTPSRDKIIRPLRQGNEHRGMYSLTSFEKRFEIFTNGIFSGMNYNDLSITGSVISACLIRNPLERRFGIDLPITKDACYEGSNKSEVRIYWETMRENLKSYFDEYYPSMDAVNTDGLDEVQIAELESKLSDIDIIVGAISDSEFDKRSIEVYNHIRSKITESLGREPSKSELNIIRSTTQVSYKYNIIGTKCAQNIELFRIFETHPVGSVSRFHFGVVRGYYDGNRVKVLPTLWCAAQSGVCIDYKWMAYTYSPQTLILKYFIRGMYILLNEDEHKSMKEYVDDNPEKWGLLDEFAETDQNHNNSDSDNETDETIGDDRDISVSIMNPIFNPRANNIGIWKEINDIVQNRSAPNTSLRWVKDARNFDKLITPLEESKSNRFGFDLGFRHPAGHIKPIKLWKITPYESELSESGKYFII